VTAAGTRDVPLDARSILYDRRFAASCTFGAEMARRGGSVRAIDGDVTASGAKSSRRFGRVARVSSPG
jgi:hypothetical protein